MFLRRRNTPAIVVEGLGPVAGLRRSARLLRPRLWPVLGIAVLTYLVAALVGVLAAVIPARRAARLDVLRAISTE